MKKLLFLFILFFSSLLLQAQMRFQADAISIRFYSDSIEQFEEWDVWRFSNVIITITDKNVHVYSNFEQHYMIISEVKDITSDEGNILIFDVLDINGSRCSIEVIHYKTGENEMYIRWTNLQIAYKFKRL